MIIKQHQQLKEYNTFGIEARANRFISLDNENEAHDFIVSNNMRSEEILILGGGSNLLFTGDYKGTVIHPVSDRIEMVMRGEDTVFVAAWAGTRWDELVAWAVERELGGIENLSYIPGSVGAVPIQNIGAYGAEVADVITTVRAISLEDGSFREFNRAECEFGYRNSIFKNELRGKYLITTVIFELSRCPSNFNISYGDLEKRVESLGEVNLMNIRKAVTEVRKQKLPEPSEFGNAGSFFKNPVIDKELALELEKEFKGIPSWPAQDEKVKMAAAWLIEQCGYKGYSRGKAGIHQNQPLVIINLGNATGDEILELSRQVGDSVYKKFGIKLEREVNVV